MLDQPFNRRGKIPQEYYQMDNKEVYPLEPKPIWVIEEDSVDSAVDAVEDYPEAAEEVAAITPLQKIKIKVYAVHLEKMSSAMVIKGNHTRW